MDNNQQADLELQQEFEEFNKKHPGMLRNLAEFEGFKARIEDNAEVNFDRKWGPCHAC
jgi:hypothetical protein